MVGTLNASASGGAHQGGRSEYGHGAEVVPGNAGRELGGTGWSGPRRPPLPALWVLRGHRRNSMVPVCEHATGWKLWLAVHHGMRSASLWRALREGPA
jgi:hypothetical protein